MSYCSVCGEVVPPGGIPDCLCGPCFAAEKEREQEADKAREAQGQPAPRHVRVFPGRWRGEMDWFRLECLACGKYQHVFAPGGWTATDARTQLGHFTLAHEHCGLPTHAPTSVAH